MSTLGGVQYTGGYHEYTGGVQYIEGISLSTSGGVQYTGRYHEYTGGVQYTWGYHEYTEGCSVQWSFHTNSNVLPMIFPHTYHDIPRCTEHPPLYCTPPVYCTDIMLGDSHHI